MKRVLFICFCLLSTVMYAQTIDSLKYELSYYKSGEKDGGKIALARELHIKAPFDSQGVSYICQYYYDRNIDSVNIFLNKLIKNFPDSTKAYIRKAENITFIRGVNHEKEKVKCLERGYLADSLDLEINYMLAELYYNDFLRPYFKPSWGIGIKEDRNNNLSSLRPARKRVFIKAEDKALFYLNNLKRINSQLEKIVFFPIQQIEKYKNRQWVVKSPQTIDNDCYFPIWYFINLEEGWESDLSRDYLFDLEMSPSKGLSYFLQNIDEPCLYNNKNISNSEVFRFTWLRTFHNPICLRLERINESYTLHWKLLDGAGGYDYGKLKISKSKKISKSEWDRFKNLFNAIKLSELPNRSYYPMTDGASWTIEYWTPDMFKAHDTNIPSANIISCCKYLLQLTKLNIKEEDIY
ncbi:hypothetical protein JGH11_18225 [Dysgonomonas sp. Marseille-P4677]|uniref:hypothetical protein n=1 Tax=Dysgonomonas sp. Marseille-P4677 TaxID=2364790 RepID=UPI001914CA73|nr:hypothetical protein [Dysgonomonas sp. Marseille-P4677]MBK5722812.1 hypothetical protein [Dysgonomonas sp. Marseille-P4677]